MLCFAVEYTEEMIVVRLEGCRGLPHCDAVVNDVPHHPEDADQLRAQQSIGEESAAKATRGSRRRRSKSLLDILRYWLCVPSQGEHGLD